MSEHSPYIYTDKVGAGPEHPKKRWGLFSTELTPDEAAARYTLNAVQRSDWFGIVQLEPGDERPRASLQMCPRANGVVLDKLGSVHGSIETSYSWRAYYDPSPPAPYEGAEERVFLSSITWYVYPDEQQFYRRNQSIGHISMHFSVNGDARQDQVTSRGFGEPSEVDTKEFHGVDVSVNWFPIPAFGDWGRFFQPEFAR